MDFASVIEFLKQFKTEKVMAYAQEMDLNTAMEHPYFLLAIGTLAVVAYLMRWRLLLVTVMSITGFIYLLGYTLEQGTSLESGMPTESLVILIGGGAFIVFLAIYILFIRGEGVKRLSGFDPIGQPQHINCIHNPAWRRLQSSTRDATFSLLIRVKCPADQQDKDGIDTIED